jgi:hypothetical protein
VWLPDSRSIFDKCPSRLKKYRVYLRGVVAELEKTYGEMELRTGEVLEYCGITLD